MINTPQKLENETNPQETYFNDVIDAIAHGVKVHSKKGISDDFALFKCDEKTETFMRNMSRAGYFLEDYIATGPIPIIEKMEAKKKITPEEATKIKNQIKTIGKAMNNVLLKDIELIAILRRNNENNFILKGLFKLLNDNTSEPIEEEGITDKIKNAILGKEEKTQNEQG